MIVSNTSSEANHHSVILGTDQPMPLDCGTMMRDISVSYNTYGTLNADKSNAVLVCHALTGDQYAASQQPLTGKDGWWTIMIGPGKVLDTDKYFIVCSNVLGGCMGTTGPKDINPETGKPYALDFPIITIGDMVRLQALLQDYLEIPDWFSVIGGSMGGMQVLEWASSYSERCFSVIPIATAAKHSAQNIAFHEVGRQAVMADPNWHGGHYQEQNSKPRAGLAVARMAAHVTYLSESALHRKFGRNLQDRDKLAYGFDADFQVESYLRYQGINFVDRFDPNSYLYITRAMDYFDLARDNGGSLAKAFEGADTRFCVVSFSSDWLFPTTESKEIVRALNAVAANVSFVEIETDKGHDAFLLDTPHMLETIGGFLQSTAQRRGIAA
ncbi:homoserine O-acetyltransferase MetX [Sneathiella aquimaris]|uniref:homoserine O-acetyltransferase MetX n=2 Tax=Sneathiella aquimaris TaxID=2599305 RepID=UPI003CCD8E9E